ncbi:MAG TPA: serine hydrolase domain-containing protein [Acidimicrobiales bacterium]
MDELATDGRAPARDEVAVGGTVAPGFEGVREAFAANFAEHGEVGAAFSLVVDGRTVVDLWGGVADAATGAPYTEDTLQLVFSSTKGATAVCANLLAQRGELDVDAPVASYWPEFGGAGKGDIPVRWLLCHKSGLPFVDAPLDLDQLLAWDPAVEALAAMSPVWQPGTAHGYHAVTYGWLVGEVVRRITGTSLGAFFADEVAGPLGLDFWIGLPDDQQARVAPLTNRGLGRRLAAAAAAPTGTATTAGASPPAGENPLVDALGALDGAAAQPGGDGLGGLAETISQLLGPDALLLKALGGSTALPLVGEGAFNRPDVWAAELPAANGVTNARSLARMYAATIGAVDGSDAGPLLSPEQVRAASTTQTSGADQVLFFETTFGLGFMTSSPFAPYGGPRSFGHAGAGGSVGFADPDNGLGFGYVMNRMMTNLSGDPRSRGLVAAVYEAIGVEPVFV